MERFKVGDKLKVIRDIPTIDGVLYKEEIVKVEEPKFACAPLTVAPPPIPTIGLTEDGKLE